jgi:hypothetical protein
MTYRSTFISGLLLSMLSALIPPLALGANPAADASSPDTAENTIDPHPYIFAQDRQG